MRCIYDKTIECVINPGPRTKDFECLECYKPEKPKKKPILKKKKVASKKKPKKIRKRLRGRLR